jgi:hypothetical protein
MLPTRAVFARQGTLKVGWAKEKRRKEEVKENDEK